MEAGERFEAEKYVEVYQNGGNPVVIVDLEKCDVAYYEDEKVPRYEVISKGHLVGRYSSLEQARNKLEEGDSIKGLMEASA